jgi:hypothetical protein
MGEIAENHEDSFSGKDGGRGLHYLCITRSTI